MVRFPAMMMTMPALFLLLLPALAQSQTTVRYDWLTQGEVSGRLELTIHGDGERSVRFEYNDRGRGPSLDERYRVAAGGLMESLRVRGRAYMGAPVDETFEHRSDAAHWRSTLEAGSLATPLDAFYLANDGTPEHLAALARALLAAPEWTLPLWPSGRAGIERLAVEEVELDGDRRSVSLYAISGLGFGPSYIWLDDRHELFALSRGWSGLAPRGASALLPRLAERQDEARRAVQQRLARELTHTVPDALCLADFAVLDVDSGRRLPGSTVRVERGRIADVGVIGAVDCDGLPVIQGNGRTLMPGLWDMHVHLSATDGVLHLAAGVTTVRDLANDHDRLMDLVDRIERGEAIGPRVYRAGFIDAKGPFAAPTGNLAGSLDEALAFIDQLDRQGYSHIKIYSSIHPDWVEPMAAEMRRRGITLSGHVPSGMSAAEAVRAGFAEIQHINMLFLNFLAGPGDDTRTPLRFTLMAEKAADLDLHSPEVTGFIDLLGERGTVVDPTVAIFDSMLRHRPGQLDPSFAMIADHLPPDVRRSMLSGGLRIDDENADRYVASADAMLRLIARLHAAGVPLVAGTDNLAGFTLHRELELYARAGIPSADVLRIATIGAARVMGADGSMGRIAQGYVADLIAVDGDPLEDISALRRVALTLTGQRLYQPAALHRALGIEPFAHALAPPQP
jgi:cytosine/adenosine deaminase-related metal-dependent hydrolase